MPPSHSNVPLGTCTPGFSGTITSFSPNADAETASIIDRLREMGFSEDLGVEVLHQNPFGKDPIAVKVGSMTLALRRAEANLIEVVPT